MRLVAALAILLLVLLAPAVDARRLVLCGGEGAVGDLCDNEVPDHLDAPFLPSAPHLGPFLERVPGEPGGDPVQVPLLSCQLLPPRLPGGPRLLTDALERMGPGAAVVELEANLRDQLAPRAICADVLA